MPPASSIAWSAPAPPSVVAEPPTATRITAAPACRGGGDQLAGAVGGGVPGVLLVVGHEAEAGRHRHLDDRGAAVLDQAEAGADGLAERALDGHGEQLAAELGEQRVERALAAVGDRAEVGRHQAGALEPAADRARDLGGVERALERVGGDEDGTLRDSHGRIVSGFARVAATQYEVFSLDGVEVKLSSPDKVYFPACGVTKGQLAHFYVDCADAVLNHLRERPTVLEALRGRDRGRALLPEAGAEEAA